MPSMDETAARRAITAGRTCLGIEFGSTRIKACLVDAGHPSEVLGSGSHEWENDYVDGFWTYPLTAVWSGVQAAYEGLVADVQARWGVAPETFGAIGVSAMMHGYLAFDADGELLVPFRTWRNTTTGQAAAELGALFETNIPLRWSIAHLHQAVLDGEPHLAKIRFVTTLAGYVHWRLTGEKVLGIGDASGMFPLDSDSAGYDAALVARYDRLADGRVRPLEQLLPRVLSAGEAAGSLTAAGAALLDPSGRLHASIPLCPPEGDAGTGMVATCAIAPRTGNVSAGTSIFAMAVLERPLSRVHEELDIVATPDGHPVAMVHCNNGASELAATVGLFSRFAEAAGMPLDSDAAYRTLFTEALSGDADAGGILAYNQLAGEPVAGLSEGRPLVVRTPDSELSLGNFMRAQLYGVFGTLALGMRVLAEEGVALDRVYAHGGIFRTARVAQRFLAAALDTPVSVAQTASEGGAWGIAVLAAYAMRPGSARDLDAYLRERVFNGVVFTTADPDPGDAMGFAVYLDRYRAGLATERAALDAIPLRGGQR